MHIDLFLAGVYEFYLKLAKLNKQFFKKWTLSMGNYLYENKKRFTTMKPEEITLTVRKSVLCGFYAAKPYIFEQFKQVSI